MSLPPPTLPPPTPDQSVVGYLRERDEKRGHHIAIGIAVALTTAFLGWGLWTVMDGNRDADRWHDRQVCEFSGGYDC